MFEKKALENTLGLVDDATGKGRQGPDRRQASRRGSSKGYFFEPTVLTGPDARTRRC